MAMLVGAQVRKEQPMNKKGNAFQGFVPKEAIK